jgi:hypothetical protein
MIENQCVEFKREYNDKVNKTMLGFLNTDLSLKACGFASAVTHLWQPASISGK